jgi:hypothetical protein
LGTIGLSTSAMTAMWISVAVMPTSVAFGFSLPVDWAPAVADITDTPNTTATPSATHRNRFMLPIPPVLRLHRI